MKIPVVVLGTGGHAKVILEILENSDEFEVAGCLSAEPRPADLLGHPVLGGDEWLPSLFERGIRSAFVAVGDNAARRRLTQNLLDLGFALVNAVSRHARISPRARLGKGVAVMPGVVVNVDAAIGDGAILNTAAVLDHDGSIGVFAHVAPGAALAGRVTVHDGAFLGTGCRVIPGVAVGAWTVVGAGAVVTRDLPPHVTAVGVPARVVRRHA